MRKNFLFHVNSCISGLFERFLFGRSVVEQASLSHGKRKKHSLSKRSLHLEPLEERQLLSVSQWCDEHLSESCFCGPGYGYHVDGDHEGDAFFFFDEMSAPDDMEAPPDIMDNIYSSGVYGPMSFEDYCVATAQEFLLQRHSSSRWTPGFGKQSSPGNGSPGNGSPSSSPPRGGITNYDAVFVIDTLWDVVNAYDGVTSLREAVIAANNVSGISLITFDAALSGTITLNGTALPTLTKSIDIIGPGADILTISGNNQSSIFNANTANTTVTLAGMTLTNGKSASNGGAISITSANGVLQDLVIKNSQTTGTYGGAIYVTGSDWLVMDNCSIIGNQTPVTSGNYGGGAWVSYVDDVAIGNSTFHGNTSYYGGGLALYSNGQNTIDNVVVKGNTAYQGGGIYGVRTSSSPYLLLTNDIAMTNSHIINNTATSHSGGIFIAYSEDVSIVDSVISGNTSDAHAGGICFYSTGDTLVESTVIENNIAGTYGGGVSVTRITSGVFAGILTQLAIQDSVVRNNSAVQFGGAIYSNDVDVTIHGGTFGLNKSGQGGSLASWYGKLDVIDTVFENNWAVYGGAMMRVGASGNVASFTGVTFTENTATTGGGAIALADGCKNDTVTLSGVTLKGNVAPKGGAILLNGGSTTLNVLDNTIFDGNKATVTGGAIFQYNSSVAVINVKDSQFTNNTATGDGGAISTVKGFLYVDNSSFDNNSTNGLGGAIYAYRMSGLTITDGSFTNNKAIQQGGSLFVAESSLNVSLTSFVDNSAVHGGAVVWNAASGNQATFSETVFENNKGSTSNGLGGALALVGNAGGQASLVACEFSGNSSVSGGAIYVTGATVATILQSTLHNNIGFGKGGGIYADSTTTLNVYNTTISGNKAAASTGQTSSNEGGGVYFTGTGSLMIVNATMAHNTAYLGGGLRTTTTNVTMHNTIIAQNTASTLARGYDVNGTLQSTSSHNLIGINTGMSGISNGTNGNMIGTQSTPLDPRLTPLQNNGGKTSGSSTSSSGTTSSSRPMLTHALMEDSPAINAGNNALAVDKQGSPLLYDQRGYSRVYGASVDIGACEHPPLHLQTVNMFGLSTLDPSPETMELFDLINQMRVDPQGELSRIFSDLGKGIAYDSRIGSYFKLFSYPKLNQLASDFALLEPAEPLAWDNTLAVIANNHTSLMISLGMQEWGGGNYTLPGELPLEQRLINYGFYDPQNGPITFAENVSGYGHCPTPGTTETVASFIHAFFAIDFGNRPPTGQTQPSNRKNIMDPDFTLVGIGLQEVTQPSGFGPWVVTVDFASHSNGVPLPLGGYLTGVAYNDANDNQMYDAGEGLGGMQITISQGGDILGGFSTSSAGGYQCFLLDGEYTLTISGSAFPVPLTQTVVINGKNVKADFRIYDPPQVNLDLGSNNDSLVQVSKTSAVEMREAIILEIPNHYMWGASTTVSFAIPSHFKVYKNSTGTSTQIVSGQSYTLSQLGVSPGGTLTLYVGATQASTEVGGVTNTIIVSADPDGNGPLFPVKDTVVMTAFCIEIDARNSITLANGSKAAPLMWNDNWDCGKTYPANVTDALGNIIHRQHEPIWDRDWISPLASPDPDLMYTTITVLPANLPGTFTLTYGNGVKLWTTDKKNALISKTTTYSPGTIPKSFYVEGIDPGSSNINLQYNYNNRTIDLKTLRADVVWLEATQGGVQRVIYENDENITFTVVGLPSEYSCQWDLDGDGNHGDGVFEKMTTDTATVKYSGNPNAADNIYLPDSGSTADNDENRRKEYPVSVKLGTSEFVLPLMFDKIRVAQAGYHGTAVATTEADRRIEVAGLVNSLPPMGALPANTNGAGASATLYSADWFDYHYGTNFAGTGNGVIQYSAEIKSGYYGETLFDGYSGQNSLEHYGVYVSINAYNAGFKYQDLESIVLHEVVHVNQFIAIKTNGTNWNILRSANVSMNTLMEVGAYCAQLNANGSWKFLQDALNKLTQGHVPYYPIVLDWYDELTGAEKDAAKSILQNIYVGIPDSFIEMKKEGFDCYIQAPK